ncbi:PurF, partial [mine drainage metagenome]
MGIGHVRYSTTGTSDIENAQPLVFKLGDQDAALGHNGDLVNFDRVRRRLEAQGI